ncbi:MAG: tRNA 2-thiouridine(34) synthase MnmA [Candidatus Pacebacteria bacterium]|nr:tRNA 2-thiouridine(34) synthase MnmA [Candidatus Paceibacterota bacterium]
MKTVFVGLSGGVDSSVSAALLKKQGYKVVGVFLKVWEPEGVKCTWRDDRREAMRVAAHLDIPLVTWDLSKEYKNKIVDYMLGEYQAGRTPNPDVMCNKYIKFGAFYDQAMKLGADYVATGHYAQIKNNELHQAKDKSKDQSYFLYQIKSDALSKTLFPVGGLLKTEVRKLAKKFKLPNAERKDSQGLCFIGKFDFKEFLKSQLKTKVGKVLNEKGEVIGEHEGVILYTLGERHGFTITTKTPQDKPYYIVAKDIKTNTLTVSQEPKNTKGKQKEFILESTNWFTQPAESKNYLAQIRYHGAFLPCQIKDHKIIFTDNIQDLAAGQSVVIYEGKKVLGGGVVK